ncbi:hypothetical protein L5515_019244 [Caenorhabditis briggsae]|uniref:Peptidase S1 domain-containing protein n=1 Tax=Caenorhabditis briggsae TaxID=6238 RepID=A0AAE9FIH5_CAEBR|nr:hypothetical protein L5515_019244 [Caenorhabditis briggsae]
MNRFLYLIFLFFVGIECGILSWEENQQLKTYCGTKPGPLEQFSSIRRNILGGVPISGSQAPWAVRIRFGNRRCSATIISPRHILSASHCVISHQGDYDPILTQSTAFCNENDWVFTQNNNLFYVTNQKDELVSEKVSKIILFNYCYRADPVYDDMMIWELKEDIQLNDFAQPACISNNPSLQATYTNVRMTSYGHNSTNMNNTDRKGISILRKGDFMIESLANSGSAFIIVDQHQKYYVRTGDSGGSVINDVNGRHFVIGVASCTEGSDPFKTIITSVYAHFNQICQYTGVC